MTKDKQTDVPAIAGLTFEQLQACLAAGASLDQITSLAESGFGVDQILQLAPTLNAAKAQTGGAGLSAEDLRSILKDQRKAMKPENDQHPGISAFSYPEGEQARPKGQLRRITRFIGMRQREDSLTPVEIDLFNRFDGSRVARGGAWRADLKGHGTAEELHILCDDALTLDGRASMPSLSLILRELLDGEAAANPDALSQRVADLEARIKALQPVAA